MGIEEIKWGKRNCGRKRESKMERYHLRWEKRKDDEK